MWDKKKKNSEKMIKLNWCVREVLFPYFSAFMCLYTYGIYKMKRNIYD